MTIMNFQVPLTEKFFLLKYNGYIKAGVNLKGATVKVDGKSVVVQLPKAQILETVIDEKSIRVYDESMNAFNPISINDYNKAISKEKLTMTKSAVNQGILDDASRQAHLIITSILTEMGYEKIQVVDVKSLILPGKE